MHKLLLKARLQSQGYDPAAGHFAQRALPIGHFISTAACNNTDTDAGIQYTLQVRDFIHEALYDPATGYFAQRASPVGRVDPPIDFNALAGREGYQHKLHQLYAEQRVRTMSATAGSAAEPSTW